jgi:hypothetical protein
MTEYSRRAHGTFTSNGTGKVVYLPFQPTEVRIYNYSASATPAQNGVPFGFWDSNMGQGAAIINAFNATPVLTTDVITSNAISTFGAGLSLQFGAQIQVASVTKASPAVVTTGSAHGYATGDVVMFQGLYQSSTTGMPQICNIPFTITVTGATTFTIPWNTNQSNFTAIAASPAGAFVMKVLYPFLYAPGQGWISAITTGATTTVTTSSAHNFVVGQEIGFSIPFAYGTTQLNTLPNQVIPGNPLYYVVTSVTSSTVFVCNAVSTGATAFNSNQTVASVPSSQPAQVFAIGTYNTGSLAYSGGALYPSPVINGVSTINGPAIVGSFVANTRQGFQLGSGTGATLTSAALIGSNGNTIFYEAVYSELNTTV